MPDTPFTKSKKLARLSGNGGRRTDAAYFQDGIGAAIVAGDPGGGDSPQQPGQDVGGESHVAVQLGTRPALAFH